MVFIKEKDGIFKKELSLFDLIVFGIGSTIGAGIFILIGLGAQIAGSGLIISFVIATIITLFIALNYAELGTSIPTTGGSYAFVKESFGGIVAFYVGWLIWLGSIVYSALSAVGFIQYLNYFLPFKFHDLFGAIVLFAFVALNIRGIKKSMFVQKIITLILLGIFLISIIAGFTNVDAKNFTPFKNGITPIFIATSLIFVCFIGFAMTTTISEGVKKPKHIAYALILTVLISGLIYIGLTYVTFGSVSIDTLVNSRVPLMELVSQSPILLIFMFLAAILATLSSLNVSVIVSSMNLFALSTDSYVPPIFSSLHKKYQTPHIAMLFSAFIAILFIASKSIEFIAYVSSFGYLIAFSLVSSSLFILRKKRKFLERPFSLPYYQIFSLIGFLFPLILLIFLPSSAIFTGVVWIIFGFFIYTLHTLGVDRFRIAFGGINFLISVFTLTLFYFIRIGFFSIQPLTRIFLTYISLTIGLVTLISGILFIKKVMIPEKEEKNQK